VSSLIALDLDAYLRKEASVQPEKTREAGQFLSMANTLLEKGDPEQARRAFQSAYGMSQHDNAFNEDARVQLHNLKTQQALVGLNVRQAKVAGESGALAAYAAKPARRSGPCLHPAGGQAVDRSQHGGGKRVQSAF